MKPRFVLSLCVLSWFSSTAWAQPAADAVKLVSFNIRLDTPRDGENAWPKRKDYVAEVMRGYQADVIGLQEALHHQLQYLLESLPMFGSVGVGRSDGKTEGEYSAMLYRKDRLQVLDSGTFWFSDTPETPGSTHWGNQIPRICTWARFKEVNTGKSFYVFNTHFDHRSQPSREKSAELMVERVKTREHPKDPVFLTGDFNAGESNPAIQTLREAGFIDTFREVHPDETVVVTTTGWTGRSEGNKIDYVFAESGAEVVDANIDRQNRDGRYPSDHNPVTATVRW